MSNLASFWRPEAGDETVLPDMSFLIGQKFVENAKIGKLKCDILGDFQTLWMFGYHTKIFIKSRKHPEID